MGKKTRGQSFSDIEMSIFCGQMAMMLKAGMSLDESLDIILSDSEDNNRKQILIRMKDRLEETGSFYQACNESGLFADYLVNMIRIGEATGNLDDILLSMEKYYSREHAIQDSIRNAVIFPLVMIVMMIAVIIVLLTKVLPVFNQVFMQLGSSMSGMSAVLLNIGNAISRYGTVFIIILVLIAAFVLYGIFTESGRRNAKRLLSIIPSVRKIFDSLSVYRFANGMALTLESGLTMEDSLRITEGLTEDAGFKKKIGDISKSVSEGRSFYESLKESEIFPEMYTRMLMVGSRAGKIEEAMGRIAAQSEADFENRIFSLIAVIEPVMVVILSIIVGIILLSVMLPLAGIMSGL